ncbi:MAG: WbqC family protein [Acidobacteriota bacterium]
MQPYFFPYLGYFDLINRCDRWAVFDTAKYARRHWMNRNRVLHPTSGWQYITVPVDRHTDGGAIVDVRIRNKLAARRRILAQLAHYRQKRAPYFDATVVLVERCFDESADDSLSGLAVSGLQLVCGYLGIAFEPLSLSRSNLVLPEIAHPGQWAVEISAAMGATDYLNAPGGHDLFYPDEFGQRGVRLHFAELIEFKYSCGDRPFIAHLSIVDVLMWNSPAVVKAHLDMIRDQWTRLAGA